MIFNYSLKYNKMIQLCKLNMFIVPPSIFQKQVKDRFK